MDPLHERLSRALGGVYELGALIGRGGMGAVYRGLDRRLKREVAIKVLPPELGYPDHRARFVREAQTVAGLFHPHIVAIHDVGERDDLIWFVMAFVEGESVGAKVAREGPQPPRVVLRVLQEVAQALAYAHARGVVHRDMKPDNILLDRGSGRALVTDFGIAKLVDEDSARLTQTGTVMGTPSYMAPEQLFGDAPVDGHADQYALGLVGYYLSTGQNAIQGDTLAKIIAEHLQGTAVKLDLLERNAPAPLVHALGRCLARDPADRFDRMEDFLEAVQEVGGETREIPAPIRTLIRESERAVLLGATGGFVSSLIGLENVPPLLLAFISGAVFVDWVLVFESCRRQGITWPMVRHALQIERARRSEESRHHTRSGVGPLTIVSVLIFGGTFAFLLFRTPRPEPKVMDLAVAMMSGIALLAHASVLRGVGTSVDLESQRGRLLVAAVALMPSAVLAMRFLKALGVERPGLIALLLILGLLGWGIAKLLAPPMGKEPQVPVWLERAGLVLFGDRRPANGTSSTSSGSP
jgi:serine/threonine protein kinase